MKKYVAPEIKITEFNANDIIQTSGQITNGGKPSFNGPGDTTTFN